MFFPHTIEPALGGSRLVLAVLCDALHEEAVPGGTGDGSTRTVLRLHEDIAPYRAAVCNMANHTFPFITLLSSFRSEYLSLQNNVQECDAC